MNLAWFGPLPPVRSGIAHYASLVLPQLARRHDVTCVADQVEAPAVPWPVSGVDELRRSHQNFDAVFCQIGNNAFHEGVYRWSLEHPSVVVIHDLILHHLIVEMTLARGDAAAYIGTLRANHGEAGAAWAAGRAAGAHGEIGNFLYPCFRQVATAAKHLLVHNSWAARQIRAAGVRTPITISGHPWTQAEVTEQDLDAFRSRHSLSSESRIVSMLGFITAAKRPAEVFRAFAEASRRDGTLHLLVAGDPAPGIDLFRLAGQVGLPRERWTATGYVDDPDFDRVVALSDAVVNLRYPSAGEMSGPLVKVIGAGRDVAVSDYAQFGELPPGVAVKIPFGPAEHDALVDFMTGETGCDRHAQRRWIENECSLESVAGAYERAAAGLDDLPYEEGLPDAGAPMPLFVSWDVKYQLQDAVLSVRLTLKSEATVRSLEWGRPGYRVIADLTTATGVSSSSWFRLSHDVRAGEETSIAIDLPRDWRRVELRDGLEGIADVRRVPFAVVERDS